MKKFSFPKIKIWFKPMFLTGSLAVFIGAAEPQFAGLAPRRRRRRNAFELFLEYSTNTELNGSFKAADFSVLAARRGAHHLFWK